MFNDFCIKSWWITIFLAVTAFASPVGLQLWHLQISSWLYIFYEYFCENNTKISTVVNKQKNKTEDCVQVQKGEVCSMIVVYQLQENNIYY